MTRKASQETYNKIYAGALLTPVQMQAYHTLFYCGPMGANGLEQMAAKQFPPVQPSWSQTLPELMILGVVDNVGTGPCPVTGFTQDLWDVTDVMPQKASDRKPASRSAGPPQVQLPPTAQVAPQTTSRPAPAALKNNKPSAKKLKEAVDYIEAAVEVSAAQLGEAVPESVRHTIRWLRKPITRKRKANGAARVQGST
jgi:hypothetical protein